jgi:hypothetical protein
VQGSEDRLGHGIDFPQNLIVPESQDTKTGLMQAVVAHRIAFIALMLTAVHLHHQSFLQTNEIEHIVHEWMLTPELVTGNLPVAQLPP